MCIDAANTDRPADKRKYERKTCCIFILSFILCNSYNIFFAILFN